MPEKQPPSLEKDINDQIERNRSYERNAEGPLERIDSTTLPWEVRMAVRDAEYDFADAPPGLGDNWGYQRLYAGLEERRRFFSEHYSTNKVGGLSARKVMGFGIEPWRDTPIITLQNKAEIMKRATAQGMNAPSIIDLVKKTENNALERVPVLLNEFSRARDELVRTRKLYFLGWNFRNVASGNEAGELYLQNKIVNLPGPKDFASMFSGVDTPSYFMTKEEASLKSPDPIDPAKTIEKVVPDYPEKDEIEAFMEEQKRSKENEPTGETTEKMTRLLYLVALSENPERVMEWKRRTERAEMFKLYRKAGVSQAYLILKEKGINYVDPAEEAKIVNVHTSLTPENTEKIKDIWWQKFGFANEADGLSEIGDPEMWIPAKARRGDPPTNSSGFFEPGFDRNVRINEIKQALEELKSEWQKLSPLNNLSASDRHMTEEAVVKLTDQIRDLTTYSVNNDKEERTFVTMFGSLPLERELGIRKGVAEVGCIWSKPQRAGDKEKVIGLPDSFIKKHAKGDMLAFENARLANDLFGFSAKWGYYARDYDPGKDPEKNGTPLAWSVDVEGWPYTSEFQNILAWPWYQSYKREAGGPRDSRGRFGPLMTDYLSANVVPEFNDNGEPLYDKTGNPQFVIIDKNGVLGIGRPDEGMVVCDVNFTILEHWERGESLSNPRLWDKVEEDPFRRFLLRSFFAEGKAALGPGGNSLLDTWKKTDWDLRDLATDKFWNDYKLARKVSLRRELLDEDVWKEIVKPLDQNYKKEIAQIVTNIQTEQDPTRRLDLMKKSADLYEKWQTSRLKEVFDYSDQMFWNGVMSTPAASAWGIQELTKNIGDFKPDYPETILVNIAYKAKSCGINIFGKWSPKDENIWDHMKKARKVFQSS